MKRYGLVAAILAITAVLWFNVRGADIAGAQTAGLTQTQECDAMVVAVHSMFQCSFTLQNTGDVTLTNMRAAVSLGECFDPKPCIIGVIGSSRGLALVSSDPPWNDTDLQYGHPFWEPLGSGTLLPGETFTIHVTLEAVSIERESPRQLVCPGGSGLPEHEGKDEPEPIISNAPCITITVVSFLPDPTPTPTPELAVSETLSAVLELPTTGYDPPQQRNWPLAAMLLAFGGIAVSASVALTLLRNRRT